MPVRPLKEALVNATIATSISPAQITADQNDYTPTGWSSSDVARLDSDASRTITGFGAATQTLKRVVNVGSNDIVLAHQNVGSTAANRITTADGTDLTLSAGQSAALWYDSTSTTWRVLAGAASATATLTAVLDTFSAGASQTAFTLTQTPLNDVVTMTVEGIVQEDADVTVVGTSVTYSGLTLAGGEDVEFRYVTGSGAGIPTTQQHDLTHSPLALYQFNGDLTDSSGNSLDLSVSTGTAYYTQMAGLPALYCNGALRLARPSRDASLALTADTTVEFLLSLPIDDPAAVGAIVMFGGTLETEVTNILWEVYLNTDGSLHFFWESGAGVNQDVTGPRVPGETVHCAVVRAADGTSVSFYVNGGLVASGSGASAATGGTDASVVLRVGDNGATAFFTGYISSLKVIGSALTAAQVLAEYERTLAPWFSGGGGGGVAESEITAQLTANVNDYAPTGWSGATVVLLSTDGSPYNITGLDATASVIRKTLANTSSDNITLKNADAGSAAANRFALPTDLVILPNGSLEVYYDSTNSVWRAL